MPGQFCKVGDDLDAQRFESFAGLMAAGDEDAVDAQRLGDLGVVSGVAAVKNIVEGHVEGGKVSVGAMGLAVGENAIVAAQPGEEMLKLIFADNGF